MGIGTDAPVTINVKGVSLRSGLRLMLNEIGLTYLVRDGVLLITTPEEAESSLKTVVYPVADLVMDYRTKSGETVSDFDSFIDLITSTVKPATWDAVGGPGTIAPMENGRSKALVVCQTDEVQEQIKDLLDVLRRLPKEPESGEVPLREKPTQGADHGGIGGMGMGGMAGFGPGMEGRDGDKSKAAKHPGLILTPPEEPAEVAAKSPAPEFENPMPATQPPAKKEKDDKTTVGLSQPGVFNGDKELTKKDAAVREKIIARQKALVAELTNVDKSSVPFDDNGALGYLEPESKPRRRLVGVYGGDLATRQLAGVRSLKIDLLRSQADSGQVVVFRSLGVDPLLAVTLADDARFASLRWALALAVALAGAALTCRTVRTKTGYVLAVMLATTLFSLVGDVELAKTCNWMFFAAAWLIPYFLVAGCFRWLGRKCCPRCRAAKTAAAVLLLAALAGVPFAQAAEQSNIHVAQPPSAVQNHPRQPGAAVPQASDGPIVIQIAKPPAPIHLPKDAIILPYDPDWKNGIKDADKLLVPYEKYVELWNRAYPDKKIETKAPPAPYGLADAAYKTLLADGDSLLLAGRMEIDVFTDGYVQVPLGLGGGVLTRAELDGKPARISVLEKQQLPSPPAPLPKGEGRQDAKPQAAVQQFAQSPLAVSQQPDRSVIVLHVTGKGRHRLELDVRLKLDRQGGWREAAGVLPSAPAAALDIVVPSARTELRLGQVADCRQYETEKPDQNHPHHAGRTGGHRHPLAARGRRRPDRPHADRSLGSRVRRPRGRAAAELATLARLPPLGTRCLQRQTARRLPVGKGRGRQRPRLGNPRR